LPRCFRVEPSCVLSSVSYVTDGHADKLEWVHICTLLCLVLVLEARLPDRIHSSKVLCALEYYASTSTAVRYEILNLVLSASSMKIQVLLHRCVHSCRTAACVYSSSSTYTRVHTAANLNLVRNLLQIIVAKYSCIRCTVAPISHNIRILHTNCFRTQISFGNTPKKWSWAEVTAVNFGVMEIMLKYQTSKLNEYFDGVVKSSIYVKVSNILCT
jgi:hypothetical protein